ncbi:MAG: hypothetical protein V4864_13230 [Pseudomonadota bacterium]
MAAKNFPATPSASAGQPLDLGTSVAGEEDPGASIDIAVPAVPDADGKPCPACAGTGVFQGLRCPECGGTGKVAAAGTGA